MGLAVWQWEGFKDRVINMITYIKVWNEINLLQRLDDVHWVLQTIIAQQYDAYWTLPLETYLILFDLNDRGVNVGWCISSDLKSFGEEIIDIFALRVATGILVFTTRAWRVQWDGHMWQQLLKLSGCDTELLTIGTNIRNTRVFDRVKFTSYVPTESEE